VSVNDIRPECALALQTLRKLTADESRESELRAPRSGHVLGHVASVSQRLDAPWSISKPLDLDSLKLFPGSEIGRRRCDNFYLDTDVAERDSKSKKK
jgi:hypothetical protein